MMCSSEKMEVCSEGGCCKEGWGAGVVAPPPYSTRSTSMSSVDCRSIFSQI